jgi:hypothetical protein
MHIERKKDNDIHQKGNKQNIVSATIMYHILILMTVATIIISPLLSCQAATSNSNNNYNNNRSNLRIFSGDSKPYDLTYGQWTAKWWQWAYSIPKEINPSYDDIGKNCAQGQSGPVWFLTGTYGHAVDRYCDIPAGKAILFTILNSECSYAEFPNIKTEKELRDCSKEMQDTVIHIEASIDGTNIKNLNSYRIQSSLFNFTLPKSNILGLPPQTTQAVSDGNWVFLEPLSIGKHVIHFKGGLKSNNVTTTTTAKDGNYAFAGPYGWDFPNTYHITVLNSTR